MKIGIIILARANFGRFPDKVLYKLEGKTVLEHVIIKAKTLDVETVIVSTTDSQEDQIIRDIAWDAGAEISRGEPDDRTVRYCQAITDYKLDYFISITPAAPFFDVEYTQKLIIAFRANPGLDYYRIGGHTQGFVPHILKASLTIEKSKEKQRDEEIYAGNINPDKIYHHYHWYDPEIKNRYLYDGNIAYPIQADNHRRICEYLGHFPKDYDDLVKALMGIREDE